ncbi:SgcJ/EcaC family oxidoreductase [Kitasatospora sp. NPDC001603]|uniref:SgcJ/EcaC family oxidoreductase n=1 Tax=Kitasatospora sp. NPDC001603 TaxID=3154388 RepID=UPI00331F0C72
MNSTTDNQIGALWDAMRSAWAARDADAFAAVFSANCDFTTVQGERIQSRADISARHGRLFRSTYRSTTLDTVIRSIRYLCQDLATVVVESTVTTFDGATLAGTHALAVVERTTVSGTEAWQITAFHNMVPVRVPHSDPTSEAQETRVSDLPTTPAPRLRHLAIVVRDPEKLANFYTEILGMRLFHRDPDGSCFLSDDYFSLALIKHRLNGDTPLGINHFGFHVADVAETSAALISAGSPQPAERFTTRPFAEYRAIDPEGNWFDLSAHGFGGTEPPRSGQPADDSN